MNAQETLRLALDHHQAGRLPEAEKLYRRALADAPNHPDLLHLLGTLKYQAGQFDEAIDLIGRAIAINPKSDSYHANLGLALAARGRFDEAIAAYQRAIALRPDSHSTLTNLAIALHKKGDLEAAQSICRKAIAIRANHFDAHAILGRVLKDQNKLDDAIESYRRALAIRPGSALTLYNLANALRDAGRTREAIESYQRAITLEPANLAAICNLAAAYRDAGRLPESIAACQAALKINPDHVEALCNLGNALQSSGQVPAAIETYQRAIALSPNHARAHSNLGCALNELGRFGEAIKMLERSVALQPNYATALCNLGLSLANDRQFDRAMACYQQSLAIAPLAAETHFNLGVACKDIGLIEEAIFNHRKALQLRPDYAEAHSGILFSMIYSPDCDAQAILNESRRWDERFAKPLARLSRPHENDRDPDRRLRIGYVSPDFRKHCQSKFMIPLLSHHDRTRFEIICYSSTVRVDVRTEQIRALADVWREAVGVSDENLADMIRSDRIDILVDLTMHMGNHRLLVFARKPAPVQVTYLAYPGTTGVSAIDYRLTDPWLDPPGENDGDYVERSIRLPETFWCFDFLGEMPDVGELPAAANGFITLGCLNNFCKVSDQSLDLWAPCLSSLPNSRLLVLCPPGAARKRVTDRLSAGGIASERIEFTDYQPARQYLETFRRIDISLETLPYNGHTTTLDSLSMGVPVVTLVGPTIVGRAGLSILNNVGMPKLIARGPEEYVRIIGALAVDLPRLTEIRRTLRQRILASPLMDARRFARGIENAYRKMWRASCEKT